MKHFFGRKRRRSVLGPTFPLFDRAPVRVERQQDRSDLVRSGNGGAGEGQQVWFFVDGAGTIVLRPAPSSNIQAVGHDITLHKEAEVTLRRAKEASRSRRSCKGEFLAIVSHEIRTPINRTWVGFARLAC